MVQGSPIISTSGHAKRKATLVVLFLNLALLNGCGLRPGVGPSGDSGTALDSALLDAEQPQDNCSAIFSSEPCTADWSDCQPVDVRLLVDFDYLHKQVHPIGLIARDASTFESRWQGCWRRYPAVPPADLPDVDFSSEMVVWHVQWHIEAYAAEPEVWNCEGCLVFIPQYQEYGIDFEDWVLTAVAIPSMDASIQFEEPVSLW